MKRFLTSLMLLIAVMGGVVVCATALPGCSGDRVVDSANAYYDATATFASVNDTMATLARSGRLTLAQGERYERLRVRADSLLNQWRASVVLHEPFDALRSAKSVIAELIQFQLEVEPHKGANP